MAHINEEVNIFLQTGNLDFVCKYSASGQIFLPKAIVKYLHLKPGTDLICFSILREKSDKGQIRFTKVKRDPRVVGV